MLKPVKSQTYNAFFVFLVLRSKSYPSIKNSDSSAETLSCSAVNRPTSTEIGGPLSYLLNFTSLVSYDLVHTARL